MSKKYVLRKKPNLFGCVEIHILDGIEFICGFKTGREFLYITTAQASGMRSR